MSEVTIQFQKIAGKTVTQKSVTFVAAVNIGGAAGKAARDATTDLAVKLAENGRFQTAVDIISAAVPARAKKWAALGEKAPSATTGDGFAAFLVFMGQAAPGKNGPTKGQTKAADLMASLWALPSMAKRHGVAQDICAGLAKKKGGKKATDAEAVAALEMANAAALAAAERMAAAEAQVAELLAKLAAAGIAA